MDLLDRFLAQVGAIPSVWMPFVVTLAVLVFVAWRILDWRYRGTIEGLEHRLMLRDDTIAHMETGAGSVKGRKQVAPAQPVTLPKLIDTAAPKAAPDSLRVFVPDSVDSAFLRSLYKDHTSLMADKLADAYLGNWIKVSGFVRNATAAGDALTVAISNSTNFLEPEALVLTFLNFQTDKARLEMLRPGDKVTAIGRLERIGPYELHLVECELVKAE